MKETDALQRTLLATAVALLVAIAVTVVVTGQVGRIDRPLAFFIRLKLLVTTFNVVILLFLAGTYVSIYREMPNPFTLSLLLFTVSLLLYAVTSNPLVPRLLGFRGGVDLGPFTFLPDLFASFAAVVLLYQSNK